MEKEFKCEACGYESDEPMDFMKNVDNLGTFCNDCPEEKQFKSLSEKIDGYDPATQLVVRPDIKEFIKREEELIFRLQNKEITFDEFLDLRKELTGDKLTK